MKLSKRQLKRIIREEKLKILREGTYEKLNDDATGTSMNLDQEVYFGLQQDVESLSEILGVSPSAIPSEQSVGEALCNKYANNPRYAKYGITLEDVLEELSNVLSQI